MVGIMNTQNTRRERGFDSSLYSPFNKKGFSLLVFLIIGIFMVGLVGASTKHTPSTDTTCNFIDGENICTKTLYSGIRNVYEDKEWKLVEDARSLKGSGIEVVVLENDKEFPIEVVDYNLTSIRVKLNPDGIKIFNDDIPLRIWKPNQTKAKQFAQDITDGKEIVIDGKEISLGVEDYKQTMDKVYDNDITFNIFNNEEDITVDFGVGDVLEFGYNSTTIILQDNETENLGDSYIDKFNPTSNFGTSETIQLYQEGGGSTKGNGLFKFNITSIPSDVIISDASLYIYIYNNGLDSASETYDISSHHITEEWDEDTVTWNNQPDYNSTAEETIGFFGGAGEQFGWVNFATTAMTSKSYIDNDDNVSIYLSVTNAANTFNDRQLIRSKEEENVTERPYLNITYFVPVPDITITYPINGTNYTSMPQTLNWTLGDTGTEEACWYNSSTVSNTTVTCGDLNVAISPTQGSNTYFMWANDSDSNVVSDNVTFSIDSIDPTITVHDPTGLLDYGFAGSSEVLNFTITDTNLDSCWYSYNFTNTTMPCVSGVTNSTNFTLVEDVYNLTVYTNDTYGNLVSELVTWNYLFFGLSTAASASAYETDSKLFTINISTGVSILTQSGILTYNGTNYTSSSSCTAGACEFSKTLDIPLVATGESENRTFYWTLTLFDGTTSYSLKSDDTIQNVSRIHLEECDGTYTTKAINFTAYYESNLTRINPFYIVGTFRTWLGAGEIYRISSFNKASTSNLSLCISPIDRTHYSDTQIEYKDTGTAFVPRKYFFQNKSLTNISEEINLYLLEDASSTSFIIKVQDQKLSPVTEALVYIQKYYPLDGTFKTVQIAKTDTNGETAGFYEIETVDYKHIIIKNGETLLETAQQIVIPKSTPYTLTFTIGDMLDFPWTSFGDNINVSTNLTFDKDTNIVTFDYIENTTGFVTIGELLVIQSSLTNSTSVILCDVNSTESSATLICDLSGYSGTFTVFADVNGESQNIIQLIITSARDIFGNDGLFLGMLIVLTAGFSMMWNPVAGVVVINVAVIFVNVIGFFSLSPVFIFGMIAVSVIMMILLKT